MSQQTFVLDSHPEIDWSDVQPLIQYEGKIPILDIKYPIKYERLMDIFRRLIHTGEVSQRAFYLTEEVVRKMCGSYSAWYLRKLCLEQLNLSYDKELDFITSIIDGNEKSYQLWEHRRFVVDKVQKPAGEIAFINLLLAKDNKNIHAWGYRKWLVEKFDLVEEEKKNIEFFFEEDVRNNSAWNFRYFLYKNGMTKENLGAELKYTFKAVREVFGNEAVWNYLNGWFYVYNFKCFAQKPDFAPGHLKKFHYSDYPEVEQFIREVVKEDPSCRFAWVSLVNIFMWKQAKEDLTEALEIVDELMTQLDKIRFNYWQWFRKNLEDEFADVLKA